MQANIKTQNSLFSFSSVLSEVEEDGLCSFPSFEQQGSGTGRKSSACFMGDQFMLVTRVFFQAGTVQQDEPTLSFPLSG